MPMRLWGAPGRNNESDYLLLAALKETFKFRQSRQILLSTRGSFRHDQPRQHLSLKCLDANAMFFYIVVGAKPCDLGQEIDFAEVGLQSECRAVAEGYLVPNERKIGGKSPWPRVERGKRFGEPAQVG